LKITWHSNVPWNGSGYGTQTAQVVRRLVADGRLHPSRIEEVVDKVKGEINERVIKAGKDAVLEVNLRGVHPRVAEAMGKLHFRTSYGQNVLRHSVEVAYIAQIIADMLGLDGTLARRCGFLHDIGKAMDHEMEGGHPKIGMDFARQNGEKEPVLKPEAELRKQFAAAGAKPGSKIISYCEVGNQASFVYFVARYLGYDARNYDGSFSEWWGQKKSEVVRGDAPRAAKAK